MDFRTYWQTLKGAERDDFANRIGSSPAYCHQLAYGDKRLELGLADAIVAQSKGALTLDDLPLTERAAFQVKARRDGPPPAATPAAEPQGA